MVNQSSKRKAVKRVRKSLRKVRGGGGDPPPEPAKPGIFSGLYEILSNAGSVLGYNAKAEGKPTVVDGAEGKVEPEAGNGAAPKAAAEAAAEPEAAAKGGRRRRRRTSKSRKSKK